MTNKFKSLLVLLLILISQAAKSQVKFGTNPGTVNGSALLELESTNKGFLPPRLTSAQRDAISSPATGLVIFNTSVNCYQVNFGSSTTPKWNCLSSISPSSNGSSEVSSYDCSSGSSNGSLSTGISAIGVTKTVVANVTAVGSYDVSAISNGVSFRGTGVFTSTGSQDIILVAVGAPVAAGTTNFTLNTNPNCSFSMDVADGSSNGTSLMSNFNCNVANSGNLTVGQAVSGVTQTISVDVATAGTYDISASANGVTFSASGTIAAGNGQNIVLTATGTPIAGGFYTFTLNTNPGCSFSQNCVAIPLVGALNCNSATLTGSLVTGVSASGVFVTIPYNNGNGINYNSQLISSTGVTGVTASLNAGTLANGSDGNLIFNIIGTPSNTGTATFALSFGGKTCSFSINVNPNAAAASLNCAGSTPVGTLTDGQTASGVTQSIPYSGGNGGTYSAISISSGGVSGLTATATAGSVANGNGNLLLTISGTPSGSGTASFTVTFAGQTCSFTRSVASAGATVTGLTCGSAVFSPSTAYANSAYSGSVNVPYTGGNGSAYSAGSGIPSTGVTGLTATLQAGNLATGGGNLSYSITGTPSASGTASFYLNFGGQTCNINLTVSSLSGIVPSNLTLAQDRIYFIASIYDQNYLPYTVPTTTASTSRPSNPDGTNETKTINVQGSLSTTGVNVKIPVTATGSGTLAAYTYTVNVPSSLTEDGISRDVTLSWASQAYTSSTKTITANIKAVGGTLNALKLDINSGLGNDFLGVLMGQLIYPYNNSGNLTNYSLRDIACIPDKLFGKPDNNNDSNSHLMLYVPIEAEDGKIWLNNNLGAHYANVNHTNFNPVQQATSKTDYLAYGSLFQWGRKPDGHEIVNRTSSTTATFGSSFTSTQNNNPSNSLFIIGNEWRVNPDASLWSSMSSTNNPCPNGFRVPTVSELDALFSSASVSNLNDASASLCRFTANGYRSNANASLTYAGSMMLFWTSSASSSASSYSFNVTSTNYSYATSARAPGRGVRCIMN